MTRYVALLRGVNVGTTRLAMADLRRIVTDLGHEAVETYLQSGNVAFGSTVRDAEKLAAGIERALADELGLTVPVLVRSGRELAAVAGMTCKTSQCSTILPSWVRRKMSMPA